MIPTLNYQGPGKPPLWPLAIAAILLGLALLHGAGFWYLNTYGS